MYSVRPAPTAAVAATEAEMIRGVGFMEGDVLAGSGARLVRGRGVADMRGITASNET